VNREGDLCRTHGEVFEEVLELRLVLAGQFMKSYTTSPHGSAMGMYPAAYLTK
jgi:hypothetical protein